MPKIIHVFFLVVFITCTFSIGSELVFSNHLVKKTPIQMMSGYYHPFHISIFKFDYRQNKKSIQLTMRFFIDDLQEAWVKDKLYLKSDYYDIDNKKAYDLVMEIMSTYLPKHLIIHADNEKKKLEILGFEIQGNAIQFYVNIEQKLDFNSFHIKCDFLLEHFESQQNIFFLKKNTIDESARLNSNRTEVLINSKK